MKENGINTAIQSGGQWSRRITWGHLHSFVSGFESPVRARGATLHLDCARR